MFLLVLFLTLRKVHILPACNAGVTIGTSRAPSPTTKLARFILTDKNPKIFVGEYPTGHNSH